MSEELARSDGRIFLRGGGTIFLDGSVEVEVAAFVELEDGDGGDGLGDGAEAVKRGGNCGSGVFEVGHAEARGPDRLAVLHYGDGNAGNAIGGHEGRNGFFNLGALLGGEGGVLRGGGNGRDGYEQRREQEGKRTRRLATLKVRNLTEHVRTPGPRV